MRIQTLSGSNWRFRDCASPDWLPATVPGCVHTDLLAAGAIEDPCWGTNELGVQWIEECDWEYRTDFTIDEAVRGEEVVELVADGLDTIATLTLNGRKVGASDNMFADGRWNVRRLLVPGRNELVIRFRSALDYIRHTRTGFRPPHEFNDPVGNCVRIRKQQCQFGWDWGPRLVTAGIWRDLRLEAWSGNRVAAVHIVQTHRCPGGVRLDIAPELARREPGVRVEGSVYLRGKLIAGIVSGSADIPEPELWWPAGQGSQPLYDVEAVVIRRDGTALPAIRQRIGLRTIELDRSPDRWGESFRFLVNGRPVFLKGANWIPVHCFVAGLKRDDYWRDLQAAAAANMNALRVWGGGIYESEDFYDACDELGLLVWQDFMFACTVYPADRKFLASVRAEAECQVKRLRHRACLALWCGNNEIAMLNPELKRPALGRGYDRLFHRLLPAVVRQFDGAVAYWPSSPWRGTLARRRHRDGEKAGDTHFWDVWHARRPVKDYENWSFRFVSEFGMQSYSSPATNARFCPPDNRNVFGAVMESHQKNRSGNQIILDYVSRRYRMPRSQSDLIYLSQLNQAYCMQIGVEHYRRLMPRCMGALYWQLNDCWPAASWSSIEFTGRWKALHHAARRFFAPALVTAHAPGDEKSGIGNYRASTVRHVHLHTVCDAPAAVTGVLRWELRRFDGGRVLRGKKPVHLASGPSVRQHSLDLLEPIAAHGRDRLYLRLWLTVGRRVVSEQTFFLSPPRFLDLPRATAEVTARSIAPKEIELTFRSPVFLHAVEFEILGEDHVETDNYFDLHPNLPRKVRVTLKRAAGARATLKRLRTRSLADSYE
jgi:beta-mannosidase